MEEVYAYLKNLSIDYTEFHHPPVNTVEEAIKYWHGIDATHCKNLFLRDKKGRNHFLLVLEHSRSFNIKEFAKQTGLGNLSFASPERLYKYLGIKPGSVSPFGLINDTDRQVKVFVDEGLQNVNSLGFHPNVNTSTLTISSEGFNEYLNAVGNEVSYVRFE